MTESMVVNGWMQQAADRKHLELSKKYLTMVLDSRFPGMVSNQLRETIEQQPSASLLDEWFDQANRVASMEEFMKVVRQ